MRGPSAFLLRERVNSHRFFHTCLSGIECTVASWRQPHTPRRVRDSAVRPVGNFDPHLAPTVSTSTNSRVRATLFSSLQRSRWWWSRGKADSATRAQIRPAENGHCTPVRLSSSAPLCDTRPTRQQPTATHSHNSATVDCNRHDVSILQSIRLRRSQQYLLHPPATAAGWAGPASRAAAP